MLKSSKLNNVNASSTESTGSALLLFLSHLWSLLERQLLVLHLTVIHNL